MVAFGLSGFCPPPWPRVCAFCKGFFCVLAVVLANTFERHPVLYYGGKGAGRGGG